MATIGIVGGKGLYGTWWRHFFRKHYPDCEIVISDLDTKPSNEEVVQRSDLVLFCIPVVVMPEVIREITPFTRGDQLLIEIASSRKEETHEALKATQANFLQLHPMTRPPTTKTLKNQTLIVCREGRITNEWKEWVQKFLVKTEARLVGELTGSNHDKYMAAVQAGIHALILSHVAACIAWNLDPKVLLKTACGLYRITEAMALRILKQSWLLYWGVLQNPFAPSFLGGTLKHLAQLFEIVTRNEKKRVLKNLEEKRAYVGKERLEQGYELFLRLEDLAEQFAKSLTPDGKGVEKRRLTQEERNRYGSAVFAGIHAIVLCHADTCMDLKLDPQILFRVASGFYRISTSMVLRILRQNPERYWRALKNPYAASFIAEILEQLARLISIVENGEDALFQDLFGREAAYFGKERLEAGFSLFEELTGEVNRIDLNISHRE